MFNTKNESGISTHPFILLILTNSRVFFPLTTTMALSRTVAGKGAYLLAMLAQLDNSKLTYP